MTGNVFVAIRFDESVINALKGYRDVILESAPRLRITDADTWHITLAFLGPTFRIDDIIGAINDVDYEAFPLVLGGFGTFGRGSRKILWVGVDHDPKLLRYQRLLAGRLADAGFELDERSYTPHITFSRHWNNKMGIDLDTLRASVSPISTLVGSVSLLRSESDHGHVFHEELFRKELHA